ncbi:glycerophosphodiester phosphodiesterase family protein [Luteococcus peritonei]|uniref:Glycerophosphodiester phosphodiesterase family protein n=1 Tax=Luteococcus peritonei TaxID=88874 RepID=A0ABW4RYT1_9ACTN
MTSSRRALSLLCALTVITTATACGSSASPTASSGSSTSASPTPSSPAAATFDLQAHRGGRGETTEESRRAFEKALDLGVSTLEFDIVLTKDRVPAVWHDPVVMPEKCADTAPVTPKDPQYPYVGKLVHELTWQQLQTLDCGKKLKDFSSAEVVQGNKILQLSDVFAITAQRGADVRYNIETKLEAAEPTTSATPQEFVDAILPVVEKAGQLDKVMVQSFDWRSLPLVHRAQPTIPLVLLWDETTWVKDSPWTGEVDHEAVGGDIVKAAQQVGATVLSPGYTVPYGAKAGDDGFTLVADKALVERAHQAGMTVVPWTINDAATMEAQIEAGADGIITDQPSILREVMRKRQMPLPTPWPAR